MKHQMPREGALKANLTSGKKLVAISQMSRAKAWVSSSCLEYHE
jgi:hypothetical protein